ncbi:MULTISPECIES: hypothetical protein [unclassified Microcoleus]
MKHSAQIFDSYLIISGFLPALLKTWLLGGSFLAQFDRQRQI